MFAVLPTHSDVGDHATMRILALGMVRDMDTECMVAPSVSRFMRLHLWAR